MTPVHLPEAARERVGRLNAGDPWSSRGSVGDGALLRKLGFSPAGIVIGSVYSYGYFVNRPPGYRQSRGLVPQTGWFDDPLSARNAGAYVHDWAKGPDGQPRRDWGWTYERVVAQARERQLASSALASLLTEARTIDADGVVGIEFIVRKRGVWQGSGGGRPILEMVVQGTAVRIPGARPCGEPFTTALQAGELLKLARAGYVPTRFVIGIGVVRGALGSTSRRRLRSRENGEVEQFSEVTEKAISLARAHLEKQATPNGDYVLATAPDLDVEREAGATYDVTSRITGSVLKALWRRPDERSLEIMPVVNMADRSEP